MDGLQSKACTKHPTPHRAAKIFVEDLREAGLLQQVQVSTLATSSSTAALSHHKAHGIFASPQTLKVALYGSLAATGKGHMSVEALMSTLPALILSLLSSYAFRALTELGGGPANSGLRERRL